MVTAQKRLIKIQRGEVDYALYEKEGNRWSKLEDGYPTQDEAVEVALSYGRYVSVIFR